MPKVEEEPIILGTEDDVDVHEVEPVLVDVHIPLTEFNVRLKPMPPCQPEPDMATNQQKLPTTRAAAANRRDQRPPPRPNVPSHNPGKKRKQVSKCTKGPPPDRPERQSTKGIKGYKPNDNKYTDQKYGKPGESKVTDSNGNQETANVNYNSQVLNREMGICIKFKRKKSAVMCRCGQVKICRKCSAACHECGWLAIDTNWQRRC